MVNLRAAIRRTAAANPPVSARHDTHMKFLLLLLGWCLLLVLCWPLALLVLILAPVAWLLLLPFRVVAITVNGLLALFRAIVMLPARLLGHRGS